MAVVKTNIDVLVSEGLGPRADTDLLLARDTCLALLKLSTPKTVSKHLIDREREKLFIINIV